VIVLKARDDLTADKRGQTIDEPLCLKVVLFGRAILDGTSDQTCNLLHASDLAISKIRMWCFVNDTNSTNRIFVHTMDRDSCEELDQGVVRMTVLREITYDASGAVGNDAGSIHAMSLNQAQAQHLYMLVNLIVDVSSSLSI
jgi:hypothetical protein